MEEKLKALKNKMKIEKTVFESLRYEELTKEFIDKFIDIFHDIYDTNIETLENIIKEVESNGK